MIGGTARQIRNLFIMDLLGQMLFHIVHRPVHFVQRSLPFEILQNPVKGKFPRLFVVKICDPVYVLWVFSEGVSL